MKKVVFLLFAALCLCGQSASADNLLKNAGFESYKEGSFMGVPTVEYYDWTYSAGATNLTTESDDVIEGTNAFRTLSTGIAGKLYQSVDVTTFNTDDEFEVCVHYKTLDPKGDNAISLISYWASSIDGELPDDADILKTPLQNSSDWEEVVIRTKKPAKATKFEFYLSITAKSVVLLDDFRFEHKEASAYFYVTPEKINSVQTNINEEVQMATLTIRQKGLTQPVSLYIGGDDNAMFQLSKTSVTEPEETVIVTYAPTAAGHHNATLSIYDDESAETSLFNRTISLSGTAIDPTKTPTITINPTSLPDFECKATKSVDATVTVNSENCTDYIYVSINNTKGHGFRIDGSMLSKNTEAATVITFNPQEEGEYEATVTWRTEGATSVTLTVTGTAAPADPEIPDYTTEFVWDMTNPLDYMDEGFDNAGDFRNQTLKLDGWQNVVTKGKRAWWGYTTASTQVAKATGYFSNTDSESEMETWLVTPALNFNTPNVKQFGFNIMGEIIFEDQLGGVELYYIDATADPVHMEHIAAVDALIPANNSDLAGDWTPVMADLTGQPLADVFFIAFRFFDLAGRNGVTYQLDNVSWGKQLIDPTGLDNTTSTIDAKLILRDGHIYIIRAHALYTIDGRRVE